ncbi:MAG: transcription-repair coupling factor [Aristaeellaceae bacterium]
MSQALLSAVKAPAIRKLEVNIQMGRTTAVTGLPESMAAFVASKLVSDTGKRVLLIAANDLKATRLADDAQQLLPDQSACLPGGEIDLTRGASSHESAWRRLETLSRVTAGDTRLLVTSMDAMLQRMGDADAFRAATIRLMVADRYPPDQLIRALTFMGYERVEMVEGKGQCALRGSILDVYPPAAAQSLRIEFFDDEVDSIRVFDCISQRSLERVKVALISPAAEVLLPEGERAAAARRMREALRDAAPGAAAPERLFDDLPPLPDDDDELVKVFDKKIAPKARAKASDAARAAELERRTAALMRDADAVENGLPFRRIRAWLTVLTDHTATLLDWFRPEVVLLCAPDQLRDRAEERQRGFGEDLSSAMERGEAVLAQQSLLMGWEQLLAAMEGLPIVTLSEILRGQGGVEVADAIDLGCQGVAGYQSQLKLLAQDCRSWRKQGWCVALLSGGVARGKRLTQALTELDSPATFIEDAHNLIIGETIVLPGTLSHGFLWPEAQLAVVADTDIYGAGYRKARPRHTSGEKIAAFTDLKVGDYVVHEDYGVGVYQGTVHLQSEGTYRDYLLIQYQGTDKLYVPIDQLERVQRYIGNPNQPPKLNHLGGGDWQRQKSKVKEGLRKLAFDLVALYAKRSQNIGYAFHPDTPWQREFEDRFPYELTPDQEQSVREITRDMESDHNMDRLLCGDVGYGKTEVSLRAAFKAVMDNKQVAILAPTTILAQQHYNTVLKRFDGFPVKVEVLSRFRTAKEAKAVLAELKAGNIDIIVGTHRLLAKDVQFKDLGLLIVDEEQRFGVGHKEIIKNMKTQVDVLTLSATPIPRTLHMSMVGIRDMSVLETPPEERLPVQTHVVDYSDAVIRDAILRELSRGGQVYFLYNRVQSIEQFYGRLRALVPEARIGVAHGQMKEHGLEDVMMDFYAGSYDVLLCTTIIESGLDVPTANTLIVFDADHFGLSQLYQLRGRVGRSNRQAYAYFTVRPDKMLSETAEQRLQAIREFTEFGAGFRIAMRDLEIRGAGNILGPEQHGHLATVGYDMYCKLIEETLHEVQGCVTPTELATRVDLHVDAFLPVDYIHDERQRMEMYKRIADITTQVQREDIVDELLDRFGEPPAVVDALLDIAQLRALANRIGASQVLYRGGALTFRLDDRYVPDPMSLLQAMTDTDKRLSLSTQKPTAMLLKEPRMQERDMLREGVKVLTRLTVRLNELLAQKKPAAEKQ